VGRENGEGVAELIQWVLGLYGFGGIDLVAPHFAPEEGGVACGKFTC